MWRTPCWPMPHSHALTTSGSCDLRIQDPWDSRNVQRRPHPGNPICHPDRRSFLCFQILTHASPWSTGECCHLPQPAAHSVIWSDFPLHGVGEISLGLMAPSPVASLVCGVYGVEILLPGPPLMLNNGIKFKFFYINFVHVCVCMYACACMPQYTCGGQTT